MNNRIFNNKEESLPQLLDIIELFFSKIEGKRDVYFCFWYSSLAG